MCVRFLLAVLLFASLPALGDIDLVPLTSIDGLEPHGVSIEAREYNGYDAVRVEVTSDHKRAEDGGCDSCTFARLRDLEFRNGVIEIDVAGRPVDNAPPWARGFVGIVFRASEDGSRFESFYLRPVNSTADDEEQRNHTVQYFAYPDFPWHRLRREAPGKYEAWADMMTGEWTHLEIRVDGDRAELFVGGADEPALVVDDLKLGAGARGAIGLFTEPATEAWFRNLVVRHPDPD